MSGVWDRDAARKALWPLHKWGYHEDAPFESVLDALEGCVRPAPAQTIDRDALVAAIKQGLRDPNGRGETGDLYGAIADRVLALLRPVGGVTLTREEAQLAVEELRDASAGWLASEEYERAEACDALAARFEAAS